MKLIQWKPFNEFDQYIEDTFLPLRKFSTDMYTDLFEKEGSLLATISLPGINVEELDVVAYGDSLTISGKREEEREIDRKDYYGKEIHRGFFSRTFQLPKMIQPNEVVAEYVDGILSVKMPLEKGQSGKSVKVEVYKKNE